MPKVRKTEEKLLDYSRYYGTVILNPDAKPEDWQLKSLAERLKEEGLELKGADLLKYKVDIADKLVYRTNSAAISSWRKENPHAPEVSVVVSPTGLTYIAWGDKQMLFFRDYLDEALGDIWLDISTINLNKELFGLPAFENGQKPLALVRRAIATSTASDPTVLDFFAGSGTTAHAALSLWEEGRKATFVVVESENFFDDVLLRRVVRAMENVGAATASAGRTEARPGLAKVLRLERYENRFPRLTYGVRARVIGSTFH